MMLSVLLTEEEAAQMEDAGTIPFIVKTIGEALRHPKRTKSGFSPTELTETLGRLAVNDSNKSKIVDAGALPNLMAMLRSKNDKEQHAAAQCLWNLSFDKKVGQQIKKDEGCMDALQALKSSEIKEVRNAAKGALWQLHRASDGHIMISYNWDNKEAIMKIKNQLENDGHKVWLDVENIGGSTLEAMAKAVEDAKCVLVCLSEKYKLSPNCRSEGEYTFQLKKPVIPLMMQRHYKPDGWLGMLCGAKLYVNFDGKYEFDEAFTILRRELKNIMLPHDDVDGTKAPVQTSVQQTPNMEYKEWTNEQVMHWAEKRDMTRLADLLQNVDGKKLHQLCRTRAKAPEFFFKYLAKNEGLDLNSILDLCNNLDSLEETDA